MHGLGAKKLRELLGARLEEQTLVHLKQIPVELSALKEHHCVGRQRLWPAHLTEETPELDRFKKKALATRHTLRTAVRTAAAEQALRIGLTGPVGRLGEKPIGPQPIACVVEHEPTSGARAGQAPIAQQPQERHPLAQLQLEAVVEQQLLPLVPQERVHRRQPQQPVL